MWKNARITKERERERGWKRLKFSYDNQNIKFNFKLEKK